MLHGDRSKNVILVHMTITLLRGGTVDIWIC